MFLFPAIVITAVVLVIIERRHKNPVIKVEFLRTKIINSHLSSILAGAIMYGLVTTLPLCGIILEKQGFHINESTMLLLFMVGITVGLLVTADLQRRSEQDITQCSYG